MKVLPPMEFPTPEQYVQHAIVNFPTMYAGNGSSYEEAEMKVLDQLLNVIGNGIRDNEELREELNRVTPVDYTNKYFEETIFYGYVNCRKIEIEDKEFFFPDGPSDVMCFGCDKDQHPEVQYWMESTVHKHTVYPNFKEDYSTIYQCPEFLELGEEWIRAAIKFYKYSKQWLADNEPKYHGAFPKSNELEDEKLLSDYTKAIERCDSYEDVTRNYNWGITESEWIEYNGDVRTFVTLLWERERARINKFIDDTIELLESKL